ncbi:MAG: L-glutamate gamma-semialdehyde dehydrogenase [Bdellovibrionales bacterium CG10_big_fil_rev_8_21_14_0_10_45_34]|nr:MAG: L-glutamate gamma-semialdehyde dehydrogenase [Bdellovibrionales bacterium CG10_big_fil_rev_8_21_14_0_10_45_34]
MATDPTSNATKADQREEFRQERIREIGETIFRNMDSEGMSLFKKDWWYGRIMEWSMKNEAFKTQMFRFVDVLPYLETSDEVLRHLKEYFSSEKEEIPSIFNVGLGIGSLAPGLMAAAVKKNIVQMAKLFIAGESPQETFEVLKKSRKRNLAFTVDILGEVAVSEPEANSYQEKYLDLIRYLSASVRDWKKNDLLDTEAAGAIPIANVSVKLSSLYSQINVKSWRQSADTIKERLRPLLREAIRGEVFVNLDMEHYGVKDLTLDVFEELMREPEFAAYPHFGVVIQAYLKDSLADTERMIAFAKKRGVPFTIRLVKGAYWDSEWIESKQKNWPIPVFEEKSHSDYNYEACAKQLLSNYPHIRVALGSHNVRSIAAAIEYARSIGLPDSAYEVQMLFGMAEPIKQSLIKLGFRLREYVPMGELIPGMAYLVRRLLENTSNQSFLRSKFAEGVEAQKLLAPPEGPHKLPSPTITSGFENCANLDFALKEERNKFEEALSRIEMTLPIEVPTIISTKASMNAEVLTVANPARSSQIVAKVSLSNIEQAEEALRLAEAAQKEWAKRTISYRAKELRKLADMMEARRYDLAALMVIEAAKPWAEADGDVTEAIDFCRYYADLAEKALTPQRVGRAPGELSLLEHVPRGVCVVIAPWNFPLAILIGMVAGALVSGNSVILKPAEQTSAIAFRLVELLLKFDIQKDVVQFLPGKGEVVGDYLARSIKTSIIAFTGSREVGLHLVRVASQVEPGQRFVKKCIIEMGGKNALIVDTDADLDEAIKGILYSAFGFSGQKCSALSRLIVLEGIYDRLLSRLIEAAKSLSFGDPKDPFYFAGPVIDDESRRRIESLIARAKAGGASAIFEANVPNTGSFVKPTIFVNVSPQMEIAREEVFGPVLAVLKVRDLDEALLVANDVDYGLTGGIYSRSPANIARVKNELHVGNVYINRGITGAMVERHPFGGFKMSGLGSKTGGPEYLFEFTVPKVSTENTTRRGFSPKLDGDA